MIPPKVNQMTKNKRPKSLIEEWFPFEEVGIECQRERGMSSALPPINFLHVWWARRPLTVSRAAILGSLLPSDFNPQAFKMLMGFSDTLIQENKEIIKAKKEKERLKSSYSNDRSFKKGYSVVEQAEILKAISRNWNKEKINFLDPMSGGASIPFEAIKLGLNTYSSDINPVASIIQYGTLVFPKQFGKQLVPKILRYKTQIEKKCTHLLELYPTLHYDQEIDAYLWIRTIICPNPECDLIVPLAPNWEISREPSVILKLIVPNLHARTQWKNQTQCSFEIIENPAQTEKHNNIITVKGGIGTCPRCNTSLSSEYIKTEAKNGRMGHQLVAIAYKERQSSKKTIRRYRIPNEKDLKAIEKVEEILEQKIEEWRIKGILPEENFPNGADNRPLHYGMDQWYKFFNHRQLLANMTILEEIIRLKTELLVDSTLNQDENKAIITYLQFVLDKIIDYNCCYSIWQKSYKRIIHLFNKHDYQFSWFYAEMDVIHKGLEWATSNVIKAYMGLVDLIDGNMKNQGKSINHDIPTENLNEIENEELDEFDNLDSEVSKDSEEISESYEESLPNQIKPDGFVQIYTTPAQNLAFLSKNKIDLIVIDPPYYDNVMYSELSDFFYVWMKRSLRDLYPDIFQPLLTDKDNEAVANSSKFQGMGSKKDLAKIDYEAKMKIAFKEMNHILQDNGVLTIMFTHKSISAWDSLTMALMDAGFEITASWSVHTESAISLHIAKKNAVTSTILLICRKRFGHMKEVWWEEDVLPAIKQVAKEKATYFQEKGIDGVDLCISTYGPALGEFSKYYPVKNIEGQEIRAQRALDIAREIVVEVLFQKIILNTATNIDLFSKFYLLLWKLYKSREVPYDEARALAISVGVDIEECKVKKIIGKKASEIVILSPISKEKEGYLNVDNPEDKGILINAAQFLMLAFQKGGEKAYNTMLLLLKRETDKSLQNYMRALNEVLPDINELEERMILSQILITNPNIIKEKKE